jgi:very-short-patch-repair endonuclease
MHRQLSLGLIGGELGSYSPPILARRRRVRGLHRCESPIERQLALALVDVGGFQWASPLDHPFQIGRWDQLSLLLLAQPEWGPYRLDFGVAKCGWQPGEPLSLVVECDGHEFHASREQAEYDRRRDRFLVANGAAVMRFTGREIHRVRRGGLLLLLAFC